MIYKCPGQDGRNLAVENLTCVHCGYEAEIFSDELKIVCQGCKRNIYRHRLPVCSDWCKQAEYCLGQEKLKKLKGG